MTICQYCSQQVFGSGHLCNQMGQGQYIGHYQQSYSQLDSTKLDQIIVRLVFIESALAKLEEKLLTK